MDIYRFNSLLKAVSIQGTVWLMENKDLLEESEELGVGISEFG